MEKKIEEILNEWCAKCYAREHYADEAMAKAAAEIAQLVKEERGKATGWFVLLKKVDHDWIALKCVNPFFHEEDDVPEDWDVVLSIPEPDSIPEFTGW